MGEPGDGKFAKVGLTQENRAGVLEVGDNRGVVIRNEVGEDACAPGGADALGPDLVFDTYRDAVHRAAVAPGQYFLFGLPRFFQGPLPEHGDKGVELEVKVVDPLQVGLDHLHRRRLFVPYEAGERRHGVESKFVPDHLDLQRLPAPVLTARLEAIIGVRLKAVNAERSAVVCRLTVQFVGEGWAVHGEHSIRGLAESRQELFNSWPIVSQSAPSSGLAGDWDWDRSDFSQQIW